MEIVNSLCVLVFIQILGSTHGQRYSQEDCVIDGSVQGTCVPYNDCPPVVEAIREGVPQQSVIAYMRRLHCGFSGNIPRVCCSRNMPDLRPVATESPTLEHAGRAEEDLLPAPGSCGQGDLNTRIFNGKVTDITEFPWMALLGYRNRSGVLTFECGGSLINKRYILTAAHCVDTTLRLETVRLGEFNLLTNPDCIGTGRFETCAPEHQDYRVERAIVHPGFSIKNNNRQDDIALLRLSRDVRYNRFVSPICLPASSEARLFSDDTLYVSGWGKILNGSRSNVKLKLRVPLFEKEECDTIFRSANAILTPRQVCAGGEFAKDSCSGDSGGPLMKQGNDGAWTAVGVISFGSGCGRQGWPGVLTDVKSYVNWITENIKK